MTQINVRLSPGCEKSGTELPCDVVKQVLEGSGIDASTVNPVAAMQAIGNPALLRTARTAQSKLRAVISAR